MDESTISAPAARPSSQAPVALVTGGSAGIGAATVRLRALAQRLGDPDGLLLLPGDAADEGAVAAAVAATVGAFGRLDAAVANAGSATHDGLADGDPAGWRPMVLTNVLGPALLVNAALPALRETRGRIVLLGSVAGFVPTPGNIYGATKYAVTGLAENTRRMAAPDGVGVALIAPGRVETGFWDPVGGPPDGDNLTAEQVAGTVVWALEQPPGVDVNTVVVRPTGQPV
ncbi:SDR family oxidoreductase [Nocardiopsis potens]|uniref:SDR family oxidoreductase n=1 Tax=Nocardiopsis potens TaxID=1246458 RepID=UPI00034A50E6|nr:SDR family NAD(P)-dependent oxidoreductase [Nocardiopsis potens]